MHGFVKKIFFSNLKIRIRLAPIIALLYSFEIKEMSKYFCFSAMSNLNFKKLL